MSRPRRPNLFVRTGAVTGALLLAISALAGTASRLQAQDVDQTAALRWGTRFVWFRPTDAGMVQVFASAGYRNAFAQPVTISADEADRWAGVVDQLAKAEALEAAGGRMLDTTLVLGRGAIIVESSTSGGGPRMRAQIGATRTDAVIATLFADGAATAAVTLRNEAQEARRLHSVATASAAAAAIPAASGVSASPSASATSATPAAPTPGTPH
jgi:hypothetical protein